MTDPIDRPIVATRSGLVEGTASGVDGVAVFRGIPYGADTGGDNRWRPPRPAPPWTGVRVCDAFGDACVQNRGPVTPPGLVMSEDCLSVNVWTPVPVPDAGLPAVDGGLPVLVWIYGGRFIWGAGSDSSFDGAAMAARGIVVVTLNYRLGVFGWLATPELSAEAAREGRTGSGNYGLMDQIAALRWVQENIAAFGGDPERVTIAGQSAGAASVMALVASPETDGLFHGAIAESGALHPADPGLAYLAAAYRRLPDAEREGLEYQAAHGARSIAEMRALPAETLLVGNDATEGGAPMPAPPLFRPVLDGGIFARTYAETLAVGALKDVPVITGTNRDEDGASPQPRITLAQFREHATREYGAHAEEFLALYPAANDAEAGAQANQAARDHARTSTFLWASLRAQHASTPAYTYFWTHAAPGPDADTRGAFHGSEIWYFLDSLDRTDRPWTADDRRIAAEAGGYVARFVRTGDPNGDGAARWEPVGAGGAAGAGTPVTMELGDGLGPIPVADPARFAFHRRVLESRPVR